MTYSCRQLHEQPPLNGAAAASSLSGATDSDELEAARYRAEAAEEQFKALQQSLDVRKLREKEEENAMLREQVNSRSSWLVLGGRNKDEGGSQRQMWGVGRLKSRRLCFEYEVHRDWYFHGWWHSVSGGTPYWVASAFCTTSVGGEE